MQRLQVLFLYSLRGGLIPAFNVLVSILIVRLHSEKLWGSFVAEYLWVSLAATALSWGSKEYLLRTFSQNPTQIVVNWQISLRARAMLLPIIFCFFWIKYGDISLALQLFLWTFGLFLFQSYEAIVLYHKDFGRMIAVEMLAFVLTFAGIFLYGKNLEVADLRLIFMIGALTKGMVLLFLYPKLLRFDFSAWDLSPALKNQNIFSFLKNCFPFFLIGISGLLHSRADTYTASACLTETDLGRYQILMNLIIYVQSIAAFLLTPFIKNVYRLSTASFYKLRFRFVLLGIAISALSIPLFWLIFHYFYHFEWKIIDYLAMFLLCLPIYGTLPLIYETYKKGKEKKVMYFNFAATIVLVGLCLWTMPLYGIVGGLWAAVLTQWLMWGVYRIYQR